MNRMAQAGIVLAAMFFLMVNFQVAFAQNDEAKAKVSAPAAPDTKKPSASISDSPAPDDPAMKALEESIQKFAKSAVEKLSEEQRKKTFARLAAPKSNPEAVLANTLDKLANLMEVDQKRQDADWRIIFPVVIGILIISWLLILVLAVHARGLENRVSELKLIVNEIRWRLRVSLCPEHEGKFAGMTSAEFRAAVRRIVISSDSEAEVLDRLSKEIDYPHTKYVHFVHGGVDDFVLETLTWKQGTLSFRNGKAVVVMLIDLDGDVIVLS